MAILLALTILPVPRGFQVIATTETISERGEMLKLVAVTAQGKFGFMPPPGWKWEPGTGEQVVQLIDSTGRASLRIRFVSPSDETPPDAAGLEESVSVNFSGATVLESFQCASRDGQGPGLEAAFQAGGGLVFTLRVSRIAYPGVVVEIQLAAPAELFDTLHSSWTYVLNSFGREAQ